MRRNFLILAALTAALAAGAAHADAVEQLRAFVRDVKTGRAAFTQVVTSTDGARRKTSSGEFEFMRPNRFRFQYLKPFEQLIVADGTKVWIYDADLNQVSSRRIGQALGSTPAALLAGGSLDADFDLADQAGDGGLNWVLATPKAKDGPFKSMRIGFKGAVPAVVEIVDSFGQRSQLTFSGFEANPSMDAARFEYHPPAGADVVEQ
ncbi:MAG: outer membrane lipoprotein chaperone LolA [Burkholderiales bacterium]|nr:outer membrane lipoprotein chaperone LolA [Burkholderiales bacterium]